MIKLKHLYTQQSNPSDFPSELDIFYGKQMLFKVKVGDGNITHNWRSYSVKRITDGEDVIKRFMVLHNIKVIYIYLLSFIFNKVLRRICVISEFHRCLQRQCRYFELLCSRTGIVLFCKVTVAMEMNVVQLSRKLGIYL